MSIAQEAIGLLKGHNFGWKVFWNSNPDLPCLKLKLRLAVTFSHSGEAAMCGKRAGRVPSLCVKPWHFPYNLGGGSTGLINPSRRKDSVLYFVRTLYVPRSQHTPPRLYKTILLVLHKANVAVYSEILTRQVNAVSTRCRIFEC